MQRIQFKDLLYDFSINMFIKTISIVHRPSPGARASDCKLDRVWWTDGVGSIPTRSENVLVTRK